MENRLDYLNAQNKKIELYIMRTNSEVKQMTDYI